MCGLTGMFDTRGRRPIDAAVLARMNDSLTHRGPDEEGVYLDAGVGLAHRRLSIIDLSSGQQPMFNEDRTVAVVFNGEIYNFPALTEELRVAGHVFQTHCDTEVIVHAWEQWGEDCVQRFRGMFAFAVADLRTGTLFLARDRLGIKPLYYALLPDGLLLFGSELKALLAHPGLPRQPDPRAVEDYLAYGYVPEPRTVLQHAHKLSPGYTLRIVRGEPLPAPRRYWDVPFHGDVPGTQQEAEEELLRRLREAVRIRMIAEVPLGAFLSGGVDSSAVVAMMAGLSNQPVNTCSISFKDPAYDEAAYAAAVAQRYSTRHFVERVDTDDFDLIDTLAGIYDEPFADSSAIPTYRLCELARRRVTVALSGDGGDENLAGYRRYRWHLYEERMRGLLPLGVRRPLFGLLGKVYPKLDWAPQMLRAKATFQALARDSIEGYFHSVSVLHDGMRDALYADGLRRDLQGYHAVEVLRAHAAAAPCDDPLSRVQYLDIKTYLAGDILTKVDRASMAHGLEVRVPLLDHPLVEWMSALPRAWLLHGTQGKHLFKHALEAQLPNDILYRPKMGFSVPLASWFRGPLRERVRSALLGASFTELGLFRRDYVQTLVDQHQSGRRDHSAALWSLLMFEASQRRVFA